MQTQVISVMSSNTVGYQATMRTMVTVGEGVPYLRSLEVTIWTLLALK